MDRDGDGVEDRPEAAALGEDVAEVGGEAVGEVDHGVDRHGVVDGQGLGDPRLGPQVPAATRLPPSGPVTRIDVARPGPRRAGPRRARSPRPARSR